MSFHRKVWNKTLEEGRYHFCTDENDTAHAEIHDSITMFEIKSNKSKSVTTPHCNSPLLSNVLLQA